MTPASQLPPAPPPPLQPPVVFLLSPARCGGKRADVLLRPRAQFDLAVRLRRNGAPLGEVFAFMSGLYFRGKLAYARAFAAPPDGLPGVFVITPADGLRPAEAVVTVARIRRWRQVLVDPAERRYCRPLLRDARRLEASTGPECRVVLLGSIASAKYVDPLRGVFGNRLCFPREFIGRGDMSRGGLMLRCVDGRQALTYIPIGGAERHGPRPARLEPRPGTGAAPRAG